MPGRILILDNDSEQTEFRFNESVRPLLKHPVEADVAMSTQEAVELLKTKEYPLAIVESVLQAKPLDLDNLQGLDVNELAQLASDAIPRLLAVRPDLKVIVVAHSRSGTSKEERAAFDAMPCVVGAFGWLNTKANATRVAELVDEHAKPA